MTTRRPDMKTASFPAVVAAKKVASAQLNYYRTMMAPTIEEPLPAEPAQEPDDGGCDGSRGGLCIHQDPNQCKPERDCPAFSAPPQRKPLSEEALSKIIDAEIGFNSCCGWEEAFARAVEAAHGIK